MSERERWIVYPLLFLALGAALRDKLFDLTTSKRIVCQELTVVDEEPVSMRPARVLAKIGRAEGPPGSPPLGYVFVDGQVEVQGAVVAQQFHPRGSPYGSGIPGVLPAEVWRALQQWAQAWQEKNSAAAAPSNPQPSEGAAPPNQPPAAREGDADAEPSEPASE